MGKFRTTWPDLDSFWTIFGLFPFRSRNSDVGVDFWTIFLVSWTKSRILDLAATVMKVSIKVESVELSWTVNWGAAFQWVMHFEALWVPDSLNHMSLFLFSVTYLFYKKFQIWTSLLAPPIPVILHSHDVCKLHFSNFKGNFWDLVRSISQTRELLVPWTGGLLEKSRSLGDIPSSSQAAAWCLCCCCRNFLTFNFTQLPTFIHLVVQPQTTQVLEFPFSVQLYPPPLPPTHETRSPPLKATKRRFADTSRLSLGRHNCCS